MEFNWCQNEHFQPAKGEEHRGWEDRSKGKSGGGGRASEFIEGGKFQPQKNEAGESERRGQVERLTCFPCHDWCMD